MRNPEYYAAVYGIIRDSQGRTLFQKRVNTGYRDGCYQLPSGHVEKNEGMSASLIRELKEEIDIDIEKADIRHITQWINPNEREYFNIYFEILEYSGVPQNLESEKCSELYWATNNEIQTNELFAKDREILNYISAGIMFSETAPIDVNGEITL